MKAVRADFRQRTLPPRWAWWLLGVPVAAVIGLGALTWREWKVQETQRTVLQQKLAQAAERASPTLVSYHPPPYYGSAEEMLSERRMPWPQVLTAIEATPMLGITPTTIELVASDKSIRLEVAFSDYAKLLEYVDALNAGEPELRWLLVQSQAQPAGVSIAVLAAAPTRR